MDFTIDKKLNLVIDGVSSSTDTGQLLNDKFKSDITVKLEDEGLKEPFLDRVTLPQTLSKGEEQVIGNIKQAVDTAKDASAAIEDLRKQQLEYVQTTRYTTYGKQSVEIQDEVSNISNEIASISTRATYNGQSVVNRSNLYTYDDFQNNNHQALSTPNGYSQLGALPQSVLTQENSKTDETFLKASVVGIAGIYDANEAAANKAAQLPRISPEENPLKEAEQNARLQSVANFDEARELVKKIASQIASPFNRENQAKAILDTISDGISEDRVNKLLTEA